MRDQATELRKLVLQSKRDSTLPIAPAPRLVVVCGATEGVGATTMAIRLSLEFAIQGSRVVLVDGDQEHFDIAGQLGLRVNLPHTITAQSIDIHELFVRGPSGVLVLPGLWPPAASPDEFTDAHQYRLIQQLRKLGRHTDLVLIDIGSSFGPIVNRFWDAADAVVMVTSPDAVAVMNCYAAIKSHIHAAQSTPVYLIVNRSNAEEWLDVHRRVDQSCRKFLGIELVQLGHVPLDSRGHVAQPWPDDRLQRNSPSEFCQSLEQIVAKFLATDRESTGKRIAA